MAGVSDLYDALVEFFGVCKTALAETAAGCPECAYIAAGPPAWDACLVGDSMVSTATGPKPIKDVREGDYVWAFDDGHLVLRRVLNAGPRGVRPTYRVRSPRRSLVGTADHRVLRLRPTIRGKGTHRGRSQHWEREWVEIQDLVRGDILVTANRIPETPTQDGVLPDGTQLTEDVAWLLGLWVGDGYFDSCDGFCLAVYGDERRRAEEILRATWGLRLPYAPPDRIKVKSREMYGLFASIFPRSHAPEKRTPALLWNRSEVVTRAYLDGFAAADGHTDQRGWREYGTTSPLLAKELRMLHVGLGDAVSNVTVAPRGTPRVIAGNARATLNPNPFHRFTFYPDSPRGNATILDYRGARRAIPDESLGVMVVASVEPEGDAETYDLEVEQSQTFIADGVIVHNCPCLIVYSGGPAVGDTFPLQPALAPLHRVQLERQVNLVPLTAIALRCQPGIDERGDLPTPAEHAAAAKEVLEDAWALWNHLRAAKNSGALFAPREREFSLEPGIAYNPQGDAVGAAITVRTQLDGYTPS